MEVNVTQDTFRQEVLESKIPVLVDFWAVWCGPCRMTAPIVASLAKEYAGRLKVCKVNVDDVPEVAGEYDVCSIPTFMIFTGGTVAETFVGAMSHQELVEKVKVYE